MTSELPNNPGLPVFPERISDIVALSIELGPPTEATPRPSEEQPKQTSTVEARFAQTTSFLETMMALHKYHLGVGRLAEGTSSANLATFSALVAEIASNATKSGKDPLAAMTVTWTVEVERGKQQDVRQEVTIYEPRHLESVEEFKANQGVAKRILHESVLQQVVNAFERLVAEVVRQHILQVGRDGLKDRKLTYSDVFDSSSLDDLKDRILSAAVYDVMKGSLKDQLDYIRREVHLELLSVIGDTKFLGQALLRRHLIVHYGGTITNDFIRKAKDLGEETSTFVEGERLRLTGMYAIRAWEEFFVAGVILGHLWSVEIARNAKEKNSEEKADATMVDSGFEALRVKRYKPAERVFQYARSRHLKSESAQLRALVNLAQVYKWTNRPADCQALLREKDWTQCSSVYRLCIAALELDQDGFLRHLKQLVVAGSIDSSLLYDWPVFQEVRQKWDFDKIVAAHFGEQAPKARNRMRALLWNPNPQQTIEGLKQLVASLSKKDEGAEATNENQSQQLGDNPSPN